MNRSIHLKWRSLCATVASTSSRLPNVSLAAPIDETWLSEVRGRGWLLFTRDDRWHYHRAELLAIIAARARAFIFTSQGSAQEVSHAVLRALPRIADIAEVNDPAAPYIYKITASGVQIVYPSPNFKFPLPR